VTTVLVTGGTGTTGSRVTAMLREERAEVRIATRSPGGDPAHVRFDWSEPATHGPALAGVDRIYLVAPIGVAEPAPIVEPFLQKAYSTGVRRVVLLSSSAVSEDSGLGALHGTVRSVMPEWVVLRPSWFMQNFVGEHLVAAGIRERGEIVTATGPGRVAFIDATDIAAVAVRSLLDPLPHNENHVLTGPEALSYTDAAAIITELTGRTVRHRDVGTDEFAALLVTVGIPAEFAALLAGLDENIRHGTEDRVTATVAEITGRPPRSFRDFIADNTRLSR
jgi:uncharacterized protein YbjT (DUF2867 family)